jgi:hypothetical protein
MVAVRCVVLGLAAML